MPAISKDILKTLYPARPAEVKKYDYGLMIVIGGSEFYSGSPALISLAGFRAGVDMVRVIAPKRAADIIASFSPIMAAYPIADSHIMQDDLATLFSLTKGAKEVSRGNVSVVIGGGMGRSPETLETVLQYLSQLDIPAVIDGDALHAVAKDPDILKGKPFLLTPNTFELTLLGGRDIRPLSQEERIQEVQAVAQNLGTTLLVKVKIDIIADGAHVLLNDTGSPYMSKGGAGDTLAGIAGALLARRASIINAAAGAAYINGKAGELAGQKFKESLVATDIIDAIPSAIT